MNFLLLAAGYGTRLRPFTEKTPKPLIPFMSVPLGCYPLALLDQLTIKNLVVNVHHLPEQVEGFFKDLKWPCKRMHFSDERQKILGSGGAVRQAQEFLGRGDFIYANADEVILPLSYWSPKELLETHRSHGGIATILCMDHPEVGKKFGGVWVNDQLEVKTISKNTVSGLKGLHFTGIILFSDRIFNYFTKSAQEEEHIFQDTLAQAFKNGEKAFALPLEAQWFETGNPEDFLKATHECLQGLKLDPRPYWAEYLAQVIRLHSVDKYVIENESVLLADLKKTLQAAKIG